jgi:gamma-glutamyl-gamma-aminobutyrate hydrolase PuuD|tara:strand:- start:111 stop:719 length:609 start_codon:yes stop_codon:yes gene_type:complete
MKTILINPKISLNKQRKEVNDKIDHALINWLIQNSYNPVIVSNKMLLFKKNKLYQFLKSLKIKGIVLSGGNDVKKKDLRYNSQNFLINYASKNKIPVLGICQGMQMLGVKFGSKLIKVKNHIKKSHKLINFSSEKFPAYSNSYHQYSLKNCPKNFFITTKSPDGNIESIKHKSFAWEGWMWHPERDKEINKINNLRLKKIFK